MSARSSPRYGSVATAGSVLLFLAVATALLTLPASAQLMELQREGSTVAGRYNLPGTVDGFLGTNQLQAPFGICASYLSNTEDPNGDILLIGTMDYLRTFNRTSGEVGTWLGGLDTVYGCTRYNPSSPVIYFVTGSTSIQYVVNGELRSFAVGTTTATNLQDITIYENNIYAVDITCRVIRCPISTTNPDPYSCTQILDTFPDSTLCPSFRTAQRGISVNSRGIFVTTTLALSWFSNPANTGMAQLIQMNSTMRAVDIRTLSAASSSPIMFATTSTSVYRITFGSATSNTWSSTLFAGTGLASTCTSADNVDGANPTFCSLYRTYAESEDELYFTLPSLSVLRSLTLPPMTVNYTFARLPFPIGFWLGDVYPSEDIMAALIALMNSELNGALGTTGVAVDPNSGYVDPDWWNTEFSILVPQREYDITRTTPAIEAMDFNETLARLADYYNLTDENVYTDFNILPTCNRTKMNYIEHDIADLARQTLGYSLIYTNPADTVTVNGNPNITKVKLLMPSPFGYATPTDPYNTTTHPLLANANFSEAVIQYVTDSYSSNPDHVYTMTFSPSSQFPFQNLNEEQLQQIRWIIQQTIEERLRECARNSGQPEDGGQGSALGSADGDSDSNSNSNTTSDLVPGCVPQIGITNESYTDLTTSPPTYETDYTIFIPDTMNYSNIQRCLDDMNKDDIGYWIGNSTATKKRKGCDTGCIVGVAVAAAVVACILIVVLVVLISKRRRLATVVAPGAAGTGPEFASTLDDDDSMGSAGNPLATK